MDDQFIDSELGHVQIKQHRDPKSEIKDEAIVNFETQEVRDAVKAKTSNLAYFRDTAGMRLHLANHLQKDFKSLMVLSYDLKKKNPDLKRSVKFDEDDLGLFMDLQIERDGHWRRVKPKQARKALAAAGDKRGGGPSVLGDGELADLLTGGVSEDE